MMFRATVTIGVSFAAMMAMLSGCQVNEAYDTAASESGLVAGETADYSETRNTYEVIDLMADLRINFKQS